MTSEEIKQLIENSEIFECEAETKYVIYPETSGDFENGLLVGMMLSNSGII